MRFPILICLSVVSGYTANAQFSFLPQLGLESSKTAVSLNNQASFSPLGGTLSPQAAVRFDYVFKKGHGPFLGLATSRSVVKYSFSDPETATSAYTASRGNMQLRLEGGYKVSTKPLYFKKAMAGSSTTANHYQATAPHTSCSKYFERSNCCSKTHKTTAAAPPVDKRSWVRIQPALGFAYMPWAPGSEINKTAQGTQSVYEYNAGNWTTAMISGVGFEFGKGTQRKYSISLNYLKGIGNLDTRSLTSLSGNKPITTSVKSSTSSWNLRMGIPISFAKKQAAAKPQPVEKPYTPQHRCGQYKSLYQGHCTRSISF